MTRSLPQDELTAKIMLKSSLGMNDSRIAKDLGISAPTVQNRLKPLRDQFDKRVRSGDDPFSTWVEILINLLAGAGTVGAFLGCMKFVEEMQKMQERHHIQIKMEESEE